MHEMGAAADYIAAYEQAKAGEIVKVIRCNWDVVQLFLASSTQWRAGPTGVIGMDYTAVKIVSDSLGKRLTAQTLEGLRTIEQTVLHEVKKANANG